MTVSPGITGERVARALRAPYVPSAVLALERAPAYLDAVWPQLAPSLETAGFLGSALYLADMGLDGVEEVYEPLLSRSTLLAGAVDEGEITQLEAVLDIFHWVQPQLLLIFAALAEAWGQPRVGGQGRPDPRQPSEREATHLATELALAAPDAAALSGVAELLGVERPPDLYRAVAVWPHYLEAAWDELQHLVAYPHFRRRGRALYYYARSSARFLARPLEAGREGLRARGVPEAELDAAKAAIDGALPALATMVMHCCAMRFALGLTERGVVRQP